MTEKDLTSVGENELGEKLRSAYDAMGPSAEQEQRMLSALVEARDAVPGEGAGPTAAAGSAPAAPAVTTAAPATPASAPARPAQPATPGAKRSGGRRAWRVALPLAACLVVGAVLVGVAGVGSPSSQTEGAGSGVSGGSVQELSAGGANGSADANAGASAAAGESAAVNAPISSKGEVAAVADGALEAMADGEEGLAADGYYEDGYPDGAYIDDVDYNTEEYGAVEERGFISTKASPLSTVSADVDTASYCNVRRMVNDGYALSDIPDGAVRIEEMLNYFDYDYAAPAGRDKFSMQARSAVCPWNADTQLLVLGFATAEEAHAADAGANLVFLVDVSGSMDSPDKLDLLQDSFATLLESLGPRDRVSIVTYASGEDIVLEGAAGDDDKEILRAIYKLHADGSTNGEAGLRQAYEVAERNFIEGGVNRIVMASDGDLNVGMTSESDLYSFVDEKRGSGIYLSVLGFGSGNYKDNKMEVLADHGNGSYHYIDCIEEAERVLRDKLAQNLVPFADDVKVQVEFNPAQVKAYRLIGYENRALADEDFRDDAVDAGDVGPNAQFTVAYEVVLADSPMEVAEPELKYGANGSTASGGAAGAGAGADAGAPSAGAYATAGDVSGEWLTCTLRYHDFDSDEVREQQLAVDASVEEAQPSDDWKFAAAVIEFGMLARDSKYAGTASADGILDLLDTGLSDERDAFKRLVVKAS